MPTARLLIERRVMQGQVPAQACTEVLRQLKGIEISPIAPTSATRRIAIGLSLHPIGNIIQNERDFDCECTRSGIKIDWSAESRHIAPEREQNDTGNPDCSHSA